METGLATTRLNGRMRDAPGFVRYMRSRLAGYRQCQAFAYGANDNSRCRVAVLFISISQFTLPPLPHFGGHMFVLSACVFISALQIDLSLAFF